MPDYLAQSKPKVGPSGKGGRSAAAMGASAIAQRYQGVEKHSSGFRLLSAMGWKEGEGLVRCAL